MLRRLSAVALLLLCAAVSAQDASKPVPPTGSWKFSLPSKQPLSLLIAFKQADGKWVGEFVDSAPKLGKEMKIGDLTVIGETVKFSLSVGGQMFLDFDGVASKDGKKLNGSISVGGGAELRIAELKPSKLKSLADEFDVTREAMGETEDPQIVVEAAATLLSQAAAKKLTPEDARAMLDRVGKISAGNGTRWDRMVALKLAGIIATQEGFAEVALAQARKAERMLTDDDDATTRMSVLETLAGVLTKANKADEAKTYQSQIAKLEVRDYQEYAKKNPPFAPVEFKGRKIKSDRVVLVEVYSGSEVDLCAAFDFARDGLVKTYKPTDVVVLNYHIHLNRQGDPLTSPDGMDRTRSALKFVQQGVFILVDGKPAVRAKEETTASAAKEIYDAVREKIDEDLEKPAAAKLTLTVAPEGKNFTGKATVTGLEKPGEQMMLRFAVIEERVRYAGGNGVRYHFNVVRAMPGGAKGVALTKPTAEQTVTVNPAELRSVLAKALDEYTKDGSEFPRAERPLELKNLKLVAFIQNDATGDVLTAVQVDLETK